MDTVMPSMRAGWTRFLPSKRDYESDYVRDYVSDDEGDYESDHESDYESDHRMEESDYNRARIEHIRRFDKSPGPAVLDAISSPTSAAALGTQRPSRWMARSIEATAAPLRTPLRTP